MYTSSDNIHIGLKYSRERGNSFFLYLSMSHICIVNIKIVSKIARVFSSLSTNILIHFFLKKSRLESGSMPDLAIRKK